MVNVPADMQRLEHALANAQNKAWSLVQYGMRWIQQSEGSYQGDIGASRKRLEQLVASLPVQTAAGWDDPRWAYWNGNGTQEDPLLRIGDMVDSNSKLVLPGYVPFIGRKKTIIISCNNATAELGLAVLQSLVLRTACVLPHDVRFRLLDPSGLGQAFPMQKYLLEANIPLEENGNDVARDLDAVLEDIRSVNRTMLAGNITSFEQIPHKERVNWKYQMIFAADFPYPQEYDDRAIRALLRISELGPRAGIYLFLLHNTSYQWPRNRSINEFRHAFFVHLQSTAHGLQLRPDTIPTATMQKRCFALLAQSQQEEEVVDWHVDIEEDRWWTGDVSRCIETEIGLGRGGSRIDIWFGEKDGGRLCSHGTLTGNTGSGKSNLFHVLICGLATRYSPEDLHLYLIDGKQGVEFNIYRNLPHAKVISLHSSAELSRSILAELVAEMEYRNDQLFKSAGANNFSAYRSLYKKLPRILLLIDEYQELFDGDYNDDASRSLRKLAQMGRSAGIHLILASQRYHVSAMQYRSDILGNIQVRMMMRMTDSDVQTLEDFGSRGKSLIQKLCDKTGMVVVKDGLGDDDSVYQLGKVAFLSAPERTMRLSTLAQRHPSRPTVFDGNTQPMLSENVQCMGLLAAPSWLSPKEMETYAHNSERAGGLGDSEWLATECPRVAWLGQEFNVHGQAKIIFRRRSAQNALLIGEANQPRYGMLAAMLVGLCVSGSANNTRCVVLDNSVEGASWSQVLSWTCNMLPAPFVQGCTKTANLLENHLTNLEEELRRRQWLKGEQLLQEPSIFLFLTEADRVLGLRREIDAYGSSCSELGQQLLDLLIQGPELGIHVILSFTNIKKMELVFDRRELRSIQHRVGLRMPEDNFLDLSFKGRNITNIQRADARPICALYLDMERSTDLLFKPYTVEDTSESQSHSVTISIETISTILKRRGIT